MTANHPPEQHPTAHRGDPTASVDALSDGDAVLQVIAFLMASEPEGMDCKDLLDVIARYVDLEALDGQPPGWMPGVDGHLHVCDHCHELYEVLSLLAQRDGSVDGDLERIWELVREEADAPGAARA